MSAPHADGSEQESVQEFRPTKARQKQESKRLRPIVVLPALALLAGTCWGIVTATDRTSAAFAYLALFGFCGVASAIILGVLVMRNRRFLANAVIRISDHAIEYTNASGKVIVFDRADSSLKALLAWLAPGPNSEGINLPPSLTLFVSNQAQSIRLRGSDWEVEDLKAVGGAVNTRLRPPDSERRACRWRWWAREDAGISPEWDQADETSAAWNSLSAKQVNDLIPGTMRFWETHPLTFALLVGFGSVALVLAIVIGIAIAS